MDIIYNESTYLIPQWGELIEKAHGRGFDTNEFKSLFKDTYKYFKNFKEVLLDPNDFSPMKIDVYHMHLSLVNLITRFIEEIKYKEDKEIIRIFEITDSFMECYILSNKYHCFYAENKVAVPILMSDDYWYYDVDTYEIIGL